MTAKLDELRARLAEIHDLRRVSQILSWDQEALMPPAGAAARAAQRATIERLAHERLVDPGLGRLLETLAPLEESLDAESTEASLIRVTRRDHEKARRVPADLQAQLTHAGALGVAAWLEARARRDFEVLRPHLERQLELKHRYIACFEGFADPYDVLLDEHDEGLTAAEVEAVFAELKQVLVPLVAAVQDADPVDDSCVRGSFPIAAQRDFALGVLEAFGYDDDAWRLDRSEHPFTSAFAPTDIRLTTHFHEGHLGGVFAALHEFGHGLYERQIDPALARTPLATGGSSTLHEAQARTWENLVGRSRPFWSGGYARLQAAFPNQLGAVPLEAFFRAINRVQPSLVRVEADEVTYNLHIVLRFELERELLSGRLAVRDLPAAFDERMEGYLGLEVPEVVSGVLQDVHWSDADFGYFPTYSLGNVASVQIWTRIADDIPDLAEQIERLEFRPLREWLREHLHRLGRKLTPSETLERAAGRPLDAGPYLAYLRTKVADVAGVPT